MTGHQRLYQFNRARLRDPDAASPATTVHTRPPFTCAGDGDLLAPAIAALCASGRAPGQSAAG